MRQRVVGAISLACNPAVLIADEPTTSLDVTIQAQYLRLLKSLQEEMGLALIFITHDFGIVAKMCDRVAVMYAGRIVEEAPVRELFNRPRHPYTVALLDSVPKVDVKIQRLASIEGQPPPLYALPPGCPFAPRCPHAHDRCRQDYPPRVTVDESHHVSCWKHVEGWDG
jgi:oligopeptide/dipeptide ABC transporter ATP-binding protein